MGGEGDAEMTGNTLAIMLMVAIGALLAAVVGFGMAGA